MTLAQKIDRLIGDWEGMDAVSRSAKRTELVSQLIRLLDASPTRTALPVEKRQKPVTRPAA